MVAYAFVAWKARKKIMMMEATRRATGVSRPRSTSSGYAVRTTNSRMQFTATLAATTRMQPRRGGAGRTVQYAVIANTAGITAKSREAARCVRVRKCARGWYPSRYAYLSRSRRRQSCTVLGRGLAQLLPSEKKMALAAKARRAPQGCRE